MRRREQKKNIDTEIEYSGNIEPLEPRIMLSATWIDLDTGEDVDGPTDGDDIFSGSDMDDIANGDAGDDILYGNGGNDLLSGGYGDDILNGGSGNDILNGEAGNDVFVIDGAVAGDLITVDGGDGNDLLDMSSYTADQVSDDGSSLTVNVAEEVSFNVNYSNVERIVYGNSDPEANQDVMASTEDSTITTTNVLANDTDIDGDVLAVDSFTQAEHGTVEYNNDGTFNYTPDANYNGSDSFTYSVTDGNGGTSTATIDINVATVNDGPEAGNDSVSTDEDNAVTTGNVFSNDVDIDGDTLAVDSFTQAEHGTVEYNNDGTFNYTPDANYNGSDSFTYSVTDGNGGTSTATIDINVAAVNDGPEAGNDSISTDEDNAVTTGNVFSNDVDIDGDTLAVDSFTQAEHGTVEYNNDGTFNYTPDANYNGSDSFTYTIADGNGGTSTATININISAVNDAPDGVSDSITVNEDSSIITGNLIANDSDVDGETVFVNGVSDAEHGTVFYNGDGVFTYTPDANFHGDDSFTYTVDDGVGGTTTTIVNVNVTAVNDAPIAEKDSFVTQEDTPITTGSVFGNDVDIDGDSLEVTDFTAPEHGMLEYNGDGTFTYTPDSNFNGVEEITYTVSDGNGETATVGMRIRVMAVNDAPVGSSDSIFTNEDSSVTTANVLDNDVDVDGDTLNIAGFSQGRNGSVANNGDGTFTYTPDENFNGEDSFTYTIIDGNGAEETVNINVSVAAQNDSPEAVDDLISIREDTLVTTANVLVNDVDIDGDTLSIDSFSQPEHGTVTYNGDGTFNYVPDANYNGSDSFTYTMTDGNGETSTATMGITVNSVNDMPVTEGESYAVNEDNVLVTGNVLANDSDIEGNALGIAWYTQPENGTVESNGDGTFTYTPDGNYHGEDSFTYTITDGRGAVATESISIAVNSVNDDPDAIDDTYNTDVDSVLTTGNVLANDSDAEGSDLTIAEYSQGSNGTVIYNNDGTFAYTPDEGFSGTDTFTYTVADSEGGVETAAVKVVVGEEDVAPGGSGDPELNAINDSYSTSEDAPLITGNVLANDIDGDGGAISVDDFSQASNGAVTYNNDGTFTYVPNENYSGSDSFTYTISDEGGNTDTATVHINVSSVVDNPEAVSDSFMVNEDHSVTTGNVLVNDIDVEGGRTLFVYDFDQPAHGLVVYNDNGTFTYTPDANYHGSDNFAYTVYDGEGGHDTATVLITVNSVNDAPEGKLDAINVSEDGSITTGNLLANDIDVDGDDLFLDGFTQAEHGVITSNGDGTFTYVPDADYDGRDSFTYTIADGNGASDTVTVEISIAAVNDNPGAVDDVDNVDEDNSLLTINVLANDTDVDNDNVLIYNYTQTQNGSLSYNGDGTFDYVPNTDFNGTDSFTYTVIDGNGGESTATMTITVNSVNDELETNDITLVTDEDVSVGTVNIFTSFENVDIEDLSIQDFTQGTHGTVIYNDDGTFTYTPDENYNGSDSFEYTIVDDGGLSSTVQVTVRVDAVNDAPVAADDAGTLDEDSVFTTQNVLANDVDVDGNVLMAPWFTEAEHGTVTYNGDGTFEYVPDKDFNGTDSFTYTVIDGQGGVDTGTYTFTVNAVNDAPIAKSNWYRVNEDNTVTTGNVIGNDIDVDGDTLTLVGNTEAGHGTVTYNDDGTFTYVPDADYYGTDSFTYTIVDAGGEESIARVYVRVNSVNDAPVAEADIMVVDEDVAAVSGNVFVNDFDVENNTLSLHELNQPEHGTVTYNGDGTFTYVSDENYNGADNFTYTVKDGKGGYDTATVSVVVNAVNDAPVMGNDTFSTSEDIAFNTGNVLVNDYDIEGEALSFEGYTQPAHGTITYNNDGTFTYTPETNYNGVDTFTYTLSDESGAASTQTVRVNVGSVNDGPVAEDEILVLDEDNTAIINVLANDTDIDNDALSVSDFEQPEHGTVVYNGDGAFTYTPDENYNGSDSFRYTVTDGNGGADTAEVSFTVNSVNDAPVASADTVNTLEDTAITTHNVLANDSDYEGDSLSVGDFTQPTHGTVTYNGDGTFGYVPDGEFNGTDSFTYTVTDSNGAEVTATINVNVGSVNDTPIVDGEALVLDEDSTVVFNVLDNDGDVDGDSIEIFDFEQPVHGNLEFNGNGTFTYTPDENYNGNDSFTYIVSDSQGGTSTGTVNLTVNAADDAYVANDDHITVNEDQALVSGNVFDNDIELDGDSYDVSDYTQPDHGTVQYNGNGSFSYTPEANYSGTDSFTYTVTDGSGSVSTATINVSISAVNDSAVAADDNATVAEDGFVVTGNVLANDIDIEGDGLSVVDHSQAANGTVGYNNDGTFNYTPDANFNGVDSFTYTVDDGNGGTDTATVKVVVTSVNDGPEAGDDEITTDEDNVIRIGNLLANDIDIDGDNLTVTDVSSLTHGTVLYNGDGTFSYTPDDNFHGADSFTYTVDDGNGGTDTAVVNILVKSVNDVPDAGNDEVETSEDNSIRTGNLLANDFDADGDDLTITDMTDPEHGMVEYNGDGTFTYVPDANFNGTDSFTYTVSDGQGGTDTATVTIAVDSVNDAPEAEDDGGKVREDRSIKTVNVLENDFDVDGDQLTVSDVTKPEHGRVKYNGDGTFTYNPDDNFHGTDSFVYTVDDGQGGTDTAVVNIVVHKVNDSPEAASDSYSVGEDGKLTGNVINNDTDIDGDRINIDGFSEPEHGQVSFKDDGTFTYVPDANFNGKDSFTYTIVDGNGLSSTAAVNIEVESVNDGPQAIKDTYVTDEGSPLLINDLIANDSDADGDAVKIVDIGEPGHGTIIKNDDGTYTYGPDSNYYGEDSFTYTISDGKGGFSTATANITINEVEEVAEKPICRKKFLWRFRREVQYLLVWLVKFLNRSRKV